jgi:hypothetical protein
VCTTRSSWFVCGVDCCHKNCCFEVVVDSDQAELHTTTSNTIADLTAALKASQAEAAVANEKLAASERERKAAVKRAKEATEAEGKLCKDYEFTAQLNTSLLSDQESWKQQVGSVLTCAMISCPQNASSSMSRCSMSCQCQMIDFNKRFDAVVAEKDAKIADLEDQVRDLMFMVENQARLAAMPETARAELQNGSITVGEAAKVKPLRRKSHGRK